MVPPIGDSYMFDKPVELRERWMNKLKNASEEVHARHLKRLEFIREHGYLLALLPEAGSQAYEQMIRATREYKKANPTPMEERSIREAIGTTRLDYDPRELEDSEIYNVGSVVLPVRDPSGEYTMTLRLAQLPAGASGADVAVWIDRAKAAAREIETAGTIEG